MLFVYHVENGTMMTFDMSLALENVSKLKERIENERCIPIARQVLLVSGGEPLKPDIRVCTYAAGTDTNPIFLFDKRDTPGPSEYLTLQLPQDDDLEKVISDHLKLPPNYSTVAKRASLARRLDDISKENMRLCEECVHEQHLQQQGWAAVSANLEDSIASLRMVGSETEQIIGEYLSKRQKYLQFINHFYEDLKVLERIPVLPTLVKPKKPIESYKSELLNAVQDINTETEDVPREMSLLDWLTEENKNSPMSEVYKFCSQGINAFDEQLLNNLLLEASDVIIFLDNSEMKEVKGLSDRLSHLEQIMRDYRKIVQEQTNLSLSFQMNSNRASSINDPSILPDLCDTHSKQLRVMYENHKRCINMKTKIFSAKLELCCTLAKRLDWVSNVENRVAEMTSRLVLYKVKLNNINRQFNFLQQIHEAPAMYLSAVTEVLRRRMFSQAFLVWASDLACHLLTIHNEEVAHRKDFSSTFEDHFISNLFSGMDDMPPAFATEPPKIFDADLPEIMQEDVERLLQQLPEFSKCLNMPDTSVIINFFTTRSMIRAIDKGDESKPMEEKLEEVVREAGLESNLDMNILERTESFPVATHGLSHLKDVDRGCESETDTEEFEKLGQSPLDLQFDKDLPSPRRGKQDVSTWTEDDLQCSHDEHDKLKLTTEKLVMLSQQAICGLRQELNNLRTFFLNEFASLIKHHCNVKSNLEKKIIEDSNENTERVKNVVTEYETRCETYKADIEQLTEQTEHFAEEKNLLESKLAASVDENMKLLQKMSQLNTESQEKMDYLHNKIADLEIQKDMQIKEIVDQLNRDHKTELDTIRSRFKLMTTEWSPSDTSLEKDEKFDHQAMLQKLREEHNLDKDKAVSEAVYKETEKWRRIFDDKIQVLTTKFEQEKHILVQDVARRISEDKDKQIDILRERESNLTLECSKHKYTIQQLTESEMESNSMELLGKVEQLEKEKCLLEAEIERLKRERMDMAASVALYEGKVDAATSPIKQNKHKDITSRPAATTIAKPALLNIDSCKKGDLVFVYWDKDHANFKVLQNNRSLYFLHSDFLEPLGLKIVNKQPNKFHETGEVVDKEYCHARKSKNRFNVPKGTKFFRVKVIPVTQLPIREVTRSYHQVGSLQQTHLWQSQTAAPTAFQYSADTDPSPSLPSSPMKSHILMSEEKLELVGAIADLYKQDPLGNIDHHGSEKLGERENDSEGCKHRCSLSDLSEHVPTEASVRERHDSIYVEEYLDQSDIPVEGSQQDSLLAGSGGDQGHCENQADNALIDVPDSPSNNSALPLTPSEHETVQNCDESEVDDRAGQNGFSNRFIDSGVDTDLDRDVERYRFQKVTQKLLHMLNFD